MTLNFTGERFTTECAGEMVYEHWHRYLIAAQYASGKRVLDVASGEGYGSHLISRTAQSVTGVDVSAEAVAHASEKYRTSNLRYQCASCTDIRLPDASFDLIVSFETIEHITEHEQFLREVNRLLAPGGVFLISSPNRPEYSEKTGYNNEYHVKELDRTELKKLLDTHWSAQKWFAQRAAFHSMVWPLDTAPTGAAALSVDGASAYPAEVYFLVFCAKEIASLNSIGDQLTLVADRENSVYAEWSRTYRENAELQAKVSTQAQRASSIAAPHTTAVTPATEPWLIRVARRLSGGA
jgi:SAM-dependent methyltransferase